MEIRNQNLWKSARESSGKKKYAESQVPNLYVKYAMWFLVMARGSFLFSLLRGGGGGGIKRKSSLHFQSNLQHGMRE